MSDVPSFLRSQGTSLGAAAWRAGTQQGLHALAVESQFDRIYIYIYIVVNQMI